VIAHRSIVAWGFKLSALLMGAPALIAFVFLTIEAIRLRQAAAPDGSHMLSVQTYGIAGLLTDFGVGMDHMFAAFAGLAAWLLGGLAVVALVVALVSVVIYLIGRGVGRAATWARFAGGALAVALALASFLAVTSLPHRLIAVPLPTFALALYTLWVLIWRFKGPTPGVPQHVTSDPSV
jgi:hypothetical protein